MEKKDEEAKKKEMYRKYVELQATSQNMQQLQAQMQQVEQKVTEIQLVQKHLDDIKSTKKNTEVLAPLASGIFVKGILSDNEEVVVNVGGGIAIPKKIDEVKEMLKKQEKDIRTVEAQITSQLHVLSEKAESLQKELASIAEE